MLRKGRGNKSQRRWNINRSESSSNYCIRNPARRWRSLRHRVKCDSAAPQSWASRFLNSIIFPHLRFESESSRCTLGTLRGTEFYSVPANPQERLTVVQRGLFGGGLIRETPSEILPWKVLKRLTAPCSQSGEHSTPPDGLTWSSHYHFAYEDEMRCDNSSLMYFSSHSPMLSAQRCLKAKTLSGRARPKPFFPPMHHRFKVTEMTVREALWSKIIPHFCPHKWFIKG